jgi:hypothetical protein
MYFLFYNVNHDIFWLTTERFLKIMPKADVMNWHSFLFSNTFISFFQQERKIERKIPGTLMSQITQPIEKALVAV